MDFSVSKFGLLFVPLGPQQLPHSQSQADPAWSRAGTPWVLLLLPSEEPDLIHHPQLPFPPCWEEKAKKKAKPEAQPPCFSSPEQHLPTLANYLHCPKGNWEKKIIFGSRQILLAVTTKVTFFSLWRLWWINSCAWENRLETRRQVRCAQDRQMETVVSICYRELSEGHNSSHWFLESLICCW